MTKPHITFIDWIIYFSLAIIWGSSFILIHKGLDYFSPIVVASLRVSIAGVVLTPFAIKGLRTLTRRQQIISILMGLTGSGVPSLLYATAQTHIQSGVAGVLNSLTPIFILFNGWLFFKTKYSTQQSLGIFLGFLGAAGIIIFSHPQNSTVSNSYFFGFLIVVATFLYGLSNQILINYLKGLDVWLYTPVAFFYMGLAAMGILFSTDFVSVVKSNDEAWYGIAYIAILSVFGSAVGMILYNQLAHRTGVAFSGTVTYLMPLIALAWSYSANEYIGIEHLIAMLFILGGVYMVKKSSK